MARDHHFVGFSLLYGSIIAAIVCSAPWALRTAAAVGLGSAVWHLGEVVRYNQFLDGPFRYAHPQDSVQLAVFWQDWTYLNALRLRQQAAINRENRRGSKVARALAAVGFSPMASDLHKGHVSDYEDLNRCLGLAM